MSMTSAENEGLVFQGKTADSWNSNAVADLKAYAAKIRKMGFKAKAVKSNKNEWGCGSYVLMVEPAYLDYERAKDKVGYIQREQEMIDKIKAEAEVKIAEIRERANHYRTLCDKYNIKY